MIEGTLEFRSTQIYNEGRDAGIIQGRDDGRRDQSREDALATIKMLRDIGFSDRRIKREILQNYTWDETEIDRVIKESKASWETTN